MPEHWVVNASPLILLAKIGRVDLLLSLTAELVIPRAVVEEIEAGPAEDPARRLITTSQFKIIETPNPTPSEISAWDLGAGETAVIACCHTDKKWTAILDDGMARRCAASFSIPVKGTLSVIILAKQRGLIESAADNIRALKSAGFRIDESIVREAFIATVGETWGAE